MYKENPTFTAGGKSHASNNNFQINEGTALFLQQRVVNHATVQF
jgi:hypothetical protein